MKILFAALKHDYGDPRRGFSFEYESFYKTLVHCGHIVHYFDFYDRIGKVGRNEMNQELRLLIEQTKPDLLFCCLVNDELDKRVIGDISKNTKTVTYNWFFDDEWRFDNFSRYWAPAFDWISTTDATAVKKYYATRYYNVIKTQYAYNHFMYNTKLNAPKQYDVTFIGQLHGTRKKLIAWLQEKGIKVDTFGYGTAYGRLTQEDMVRVIQRSKINLCLMNLSRDPNWKGALKVFFKKADGRIHADVTNIPQNLKFFIAKQRLQIKARNFEIPGAGGFTITNHMNELENFFAIGKEIVTFKRKRDLIEKIRYYLVHSEEREKIAAAGYERAFRDHTYAKRFNAIFTYIFGKNPKRKL